MSIILGVGHENFFKSGTRGVLTILFSTLIGVMVYHFFYNSLVYEAKIKLAKDLLPLLSDEYPQDPRFGSMVVDIDQRDLTVRHMGWPPPMALYTAALKAAINRNASAIYLDVVFTESKQADELDDFLQTACEAKRAGIAVFLPRMPGGPVGQPQSATLIKMSAARTGVAPNAEPCIGLVSQEILVEKADQAVWEYRLTAGTQNNQRDGSASPAFAIAQHLKPGAAKIYTQNMALSWPTHGNPENQDYVYMRKKPNSGDQERQADCILQWNKAKQFSIFKVSKGVGDMTNGNAPLCARHWQLNLAELMNEPNKNFHVRLPNALSGQKNVFFIGSSFLGGGKAIVTPLEQVLPATHVHAVALDNLLNWGENYPRTGNLLSFQVADPGFWFALGTLLSICLFGTLWQAIHLSSLLRVLRKSRLLRKNPVLVGIGNRNRHQQRWIKRIGRTAFGMVWLVLGFWLILLLGRALHIATLELMPFVALPLLSIFMNLGKTMTKYLGIFLFCMRSTTRLATMHACLNHEAKIGRR